MATAKDIWDKLSKIDVSEHVEKKNNLSYLPWAWAWGTLMKSYPQATYEFREFAREDDTITDILQYPANGTASVHCTVTIDEVSRSMWLPVMDYRNNAIADPDARAISDTRMRCLVKCIGMLGLGFYLYAGEELPEPAAGEPEKNRKRNGEPGKGEKKPKAPATPTKKANGASSTIFATFDVFAEGCDTTAKLRDFWHANRNELTKLEKEYPEEYAKILEMFSRKKKELNEAEGMEV